MTWTQMWSILEAQLCDSDGKQQKQMDFMIDFQKHLLRNRISFSCEHSV